MKISLVYRPNTCPDTVKTESHYTHITTAGTLSEDVIQPIFAIIITTLLVLIKRVLYYKRGRDF